MKLSGRERGQFIDLPQATTCHIQQTDRPRINTLTRLQETVLTLPMHRMTSAYVERQK